MDRAAVTHTSAKSLESASPHSATLGQNKLSSPTTASSRQSPTTPLVPLEYLQSQRRGSITDPSLHAAGPSGLAHPGGASPTSSKLPQSRTTESASSAQQAPPPFRFGDGSSTQPHDSAHSHFRHLLRSPSHETDDRVFGGVGQESRDSFITTRDTNGGTATGDRMEVDAQSPQEGRGDQAGEYRGRRPSLAGTKRKMSLERTVLPTNGEIDPKLIGPGVPSGMGAGMDGAAEGPAPKRRSSAFDTRLAQLQLNDRRNSVDARGVGQAAATPVFANMPVSGGGGFSTPGSAFSGDSPHGRPPTGIATFAWPANTPPDQPQHTGPPPQGSEGNMANNQGPYDPNLMAPPVAFPPDRRMSAPAIPPENMSAPPASGPARVLRSRSRPPSRVRGNNEQPQSGAEPSPGSSTNNSVQDDANASQPPSSTRQKEPGSTPYSRSPELRISHKLAERKRRKEMKDLFDELRDQIPADRGMKASKWEILSKAIDFIVNLKQGSEQMNAEIAQLRHEVDALRQAQGLPPYQPGGPPLQAGGPPLPPSVLYAHGPPVGMPPFPHPPPGPPGPGGPGVPPPPHHPQPLPPQQAPVSRPGSSQNMYPPGSGPVPVSQSALPQNGVASSAPGQRTDAPS